MPAPFETLVQELAKLPGVGRRSAERAALSLVRKGAPALAALEDALAAARTGVALCASCGAVTTVSENPCRLCTDPARDRSRLLVVEEPGDILAIERSGAWTGLYHALGGRVSPAAGTGPKDLAVARLEARLAGGGVREIVLALGTDVEGDATAAWLRETLVPAGVSVTRLAYGLPADSGVRYADPLTLRRAIAGRG